MNSSVSVVQPGDVLVGPLARDPGVAVREPGGDLGLGSGEVDLADHVVQERDLARGVLEHDRAPDASVVALVDRPHLLGAHDLQQPCVEQDLDVVGDAALGATQPFGELGDGHRPLEHEVEDRPPERVAEGLHARRGVGVHLVGELVVEVAASGEANVRHFSNNTDFWDVCKREVLRRLAPCRSIALHPT